MNFKIHRGTNEIGGSCVEVWTDSTRIVIDIGMPLVAEDGNQFNFRKHEKLFTNKLIEKKILCLLNRKNQESVKNEQKQ